MLSSRSLALSRCAGARMMSQMGGGSRRMVAGPQQRLEPVLATAGKVVDTYVPLPMGVLAPQLLSKAGWSQLWHKMKMSLRSFAHFAQLWKTVGLKNYSKDVSFSAISKDITNTYMDVTKAFAAGDWTTMSNYVTENIFGGVKKSMKLRPSNELHKVSFVGEPSVLPVTVRLIKTEGVDQQFVQVTARVQALQKLAVYDTRTGAIIRGSETEARAVDEFWTFEKPLKKITNPRWRMVGKVTAAENPDVGRILQSSTVPKEIPAAAAPKSETAESVTAEKAPEPKLHFGAKPKKGAK